MLSIISRTIIHSDDQYVKYLSTIRGVARVMNMCTHNARGTDLQSFSETGWEWIFPNSWLLFYGGGGTPIPAARSPADTVGGPRSSPEENLKKRSQMVASDGIFGKDIDL